MEALIKYTLLDMTQTILSSMDSDEVNSISDTTEADQVARVIRTCFFDIVNGADLPETFGLFELNATNSSTPTLMSRPSDVDSIEWVRYNKHKDGETDIQFRPVQYQDLDTFLHLMYSEQSGNENILTYTHTLNGNSIDILARTGKAPSYYTTWDDNTLLFDSYDPQVDAFLQKNKTLAFGRKSLVFLMQDSFVPPLDDNQFTLLLNESKALAFAEIKQMANQKAEKNARKGWIKLQKNKKAVGNQTATPNYGRK